MDLSLFNSLSLSTSLVFFPQHLMLRVCFSPVLECVVADCWNRVFQTPPCHQTPLLLLFAGVWQILSRRETPYVNNNNNNNGGLVARGGRKNSIPAISHDTLRDGRKGDPQH